MKKNGKITRQGIQASWSSKVLASNLPDLNERTLFFASHEHFAPVGRSIRSTARTDLIFFANAGLNVTSTLAPTPDVSKNLAITFLLPSQSFCLIALIMTFAGRISISDDPSASNTSLAGAAVPR